MFDINQVEPILIIECDEPNGKVTRSVRPLYLDLETLHHFWSKAREFPTLFAKPINDDFGKFCSLFLTYNSDGTIEPKGLFWLIDNWVGVLYLTDIYAPIEATVHYTFFDRRHFGRVPLVKSMIKYVFNEYGFNRLNANLPLYVKSYSYGFVKALGFKLEGRMRECRLHNDVFFDEKLFGILRSEVE